MGAALHPRVGHQNDVILEPKYKASKLRCFEPQNLWCIPDRPSCTNRPLQCLRWLVGSAETDCIREQTKSQMKTHSNNLKSLKNFIDSLLIESTNQDSKTTRTYRLQEKWKMEGEKKKQQKLEQEGCSLWNWMCSWCLSFADCRARRSETRGFRKGWW